MEDFVSKLKSFDDFLSLNGTDKKAIREAEKALSLNFSEEYFHYLEKCGIASACGHEFTGIAKSPRLNVVDATNRERKNNPSAPSDLYIVEELQIDGIVIWQSEDGGVYRSMGDEIPVRISGSLSEYVSRF